MNDIVMDVGRNQDLLLEMHRHKYLPNHQVVDFLESGVQRNQMRIKNIENVLKPELVINFEGAWRDLTKRRGARIAQPQLAYHGTAESNIESILERGLLVPETGEGKDVSHATDTGYWGKGIYLSPNSQMSVGYCRGGKKLLIVSVLMGVSYQCQNLIHGAQKQPGFDSHKAPGGNEWVIFDPAQVLPCYVVKILSMVL
eukprot:CAMPEP_0174259430 /NCGR_PEP_ID=MMETSP0439-20130205/8254_1 /TAXON_ID=0 /ORGANISM="Stereomyxa ramosa, Strain Chinc5" /LENGTH=198 /DNA_ID=CAMNT_0015343311 /DNA_START=270 /DNA_END=863 /DNA_ORIENTATION=-